ncbi:DUF2914 domain-containing protein [Hippea maritima]|uniref:DUF2914 domain-containing protein n=1 Tax=Hippea maritima (strain ATCC 700847 / DSM 10411 / MH2) TaxID=760142 RepID=F2LU21_HIPMA|nr:DUF2914 domain-containing protein [Hippea maritima]AEA33420.1 hypothetical protein Hipma_0448 [Hippea maritima DSM 10411]
MRLAIFVFVLILWSFNSFALTVSNIECGLGVKSRKIISRKDSFKAGDRIYCLSTLKNIDKPSYIIHRWVLDNRHFDVKLKVKPFKRFRTWSYKTIYPSMMGVWKLEVLDKDGRLLKEKIFVVK